ncbi:MAG TPA: hypothetical protein VG097_13095 [Gemmata sp.]|nr:hypothetical protein [Gemmata sp.]
MKTVFCRKISESGAPQVVGELLDELKLTRFNCPYINALFPPQLPYQP